ncbi:MAG TPA: acyltransferase [Candidatus Sulfotelmatobacter sp.]|nr:acyltransferase [Candidatus Sulfotelmatobacter sp.]HWI58002.1 acyltransferase [Bacillota bacterium]
MSEPKPPLIYIPQPGRWTSGPLPANVVLGEDSLITGPKVFARFRSQRGPALVIGRGCTLEGVHFAINPRGQVTIGENCAFYGSVLLCELELRIGNHVYLGWNAVLSDSDFHPTEVAERHADVLACSPIGEGQGRRPYPSGPVIVGNDVYIGHNATVLKGVTIGDGAFIEPGAVVSRDVPPRARVLGNPATVVEILPAPLAAAAVPA